MLVATGGFLGFALVLALVEQAFLEILEGNVRVGSPVFEHNHILLLAFCRSPRDKEMLLTVTRQVSYSSLLFFGHNACKFAALRGHAEVT
jgi:hypothetical protein